MYLFYSLIYIDFNGFIAAIVSSCSYFNPPGDAATYDRRVGQRWFVPKARNYAQLSTAQPMGMFGDMLASSLVDGIHRSLHCGVLCVHLGGLFLCHQYVPKQVSPVWALSGIPGGAVYLRCYGVHGLVLQPGPVPSQEARKRPPQPGVY